MCIICIKPAGIELPAREVRKTMFYNNSDGFGYAVADEKKVKINKGFMTLEQSEKALEKLGDVTEKTMIMHYRITTHGGTKAENCHPFPVTDHIPLLQKLCLSSDMAVAHNGIISSVTPRKNISDTMEYIASQLVFCKAINNEFWLDTNFLKLISNGIESKMVFLDKSGEYSVIGEFYEGKDGCFYSNASYLYSYNWGIDGKYKSILHDYEDYDEYNKLSASMIYACDRDTYTLETNKRLYLMKEIKKGKLIVDEDLDNETIFFDEFGMVFVYDWVEMLGKWLPDHKLILENGKEPSFDDNIAESLEVVYDCYFDDNKEKKE